MYERRVVVEEDGEEEVGRGLPSLVTWHSIEVVVAVSRCRQRRYPAHNPA